MFGGSRPDELFIVRRGMEFSAAWVVDETRNLFIRVKLEFGPFEASESRFERNKFKFAFSKQNLEDSFSGLFKSGLPKSLIWKILPIYSKVK